MTASPVARVAGWVAVLLQLVVIAGLVLAPGDPTALPSWVRWIGVALIALGLLLMIVALTNLGSALTATPVPVESGGLRTQGLYRWVRHPVYSGLLLAGLGLFLRSPGWWPAVFLALLAVILTAKAIWEERMLARLYPGYADYRKRVGRFVPRLRRGSGR